MTSIDVPQFLTSVLPAEFSLAEITVHDFVADTLRIVPQSFDESISLSDGLETVQESAPRRVAIFPASRIATAPAFR